jgi:negative regulator of flagellin synthesis FlgM
MDLDSEETMKVTSQQAHGISDLTAQKAKDKGGKVARPEAEPAQDPQGIANSASQTLKKIRDTIRSEPDVRAERVAELKAKVKSGAYKADSDKVAGKMLNASLSEDLERP